MVPTNFNTLYSLGPFQAVPNVQPFSVERPVVSCACATVDSGTDTTKSTMRIGGEDAGAGLVQS